MVPPEGIREGNEKLIRLTAEAGVKVNALMTMAMIGRTISARRLVLCGMSVVVVIGIRSMYLAASRAFRCYPSRGVRGRSGLVRSFFFGGFVFQGH